MSMHSLEEVVKHKGARAEAATKVFYKKAVLKIL